MITKMKFENYVEELRVLMLLILLIFSILLNYFFQIVLKINVIFSHFFYIPIAVACFWWKKKGLIVPILLAGSLIFFPFLFRMNMGSLKNIDNLLRALLLIVNGIIFSFLSGYISKTQKLTEVNESVKFYKDLLIHDLNNIIQNILSSTELYSIYRKNGKNAKELDELLNIIRNQGLKGRILVSNAQKLSRLEESEIFLEKLNILEILKESITFIERSFQEREINISIDSPNQTIWVKANKLLLDLFEIIIINAIKYNDNRIVEIDIKISRELIHEINYLKIEIMDNGIGISDDRKETIFKRKYNRDKYSKGMGFGLSLVNIIIKKCNGKIRIENRVIGDHSQGSNFVILIPEDIE